MKQMLAGAVLLGVVCGVVSHARAQSWVETAAPSTNIGPLVCSADGSTQLVIPGGRWAPDGTVEYFLDGGQVYVSHDSGSTWTAADLPSGTWAAAASSADGTILMALDSSGNLYASTNSGGAWSPAGLTNALGGIACSADGTRMYAAASASSSATNGSIYTSTDFGATWAPTGAPQAAWWPLACSADGNTVIAAETLNIWISASAGADFRLVATLVPPNLLTGYTAVCASLACSADGSGMIAGMASPDPVGVASSVDSGATWLWSPENDNFYSQLWSTVCCSADGTTMAATGVINARDIGGLPFSIILLSSNSGATWAWAPAPFPNGDDSCTGIAMTGDGSSLFSVYMHAFSGGYSGLAANLATPPAPLLAVEASPGGVGLSWIVPAAPFTFTVQQNTGLSTTNWTTVPGTPALDYSTLRNRLTIQPPPGPMFYRLISQ